MTTVYVVIEVAWLSHMYGTSPRAICVCSSKDDAERIVKELSSRNGRDIYNLEECGLDVCEELEKVGL